MFVRMMKKNISKSLTNFECNDQITPEKRQGKKGKKEEKFAHSKFYYKQIHGKTKY